MVTLMDRAGAEALLGREVPVGVEPVLDAADVDDLVGLMAVSDASGVVPTDPGWVPTYDAGWLNFAAAKAWERKAGRVAGLVSFSADGASFDAGELHRQAIRMTRVYLSRCGGSVLTAGSSV